MSNLDAEMPDITDAEMRDLTTLNNVRLLQEAIARDEKQLEEFDRVISGLETDLQLATDEDEKRMLKSDIESFSLQRKVRKETMQSSVEFVMDLLDRKS
jgi:hypothetical protein